MRLFVAISPPAAALEEIAAAVDEARPLEPGLRWTGRQQWHLTLAFLGEVDEAALPELRERLGRAARRHRPLELAFGGAGRFDGRVLWLGVRADHAQRSALGALADSVAAAARRCGIPIEDRPYRPHLTLARSSTPADLRPLVGALADFGGAPWSADHVELIRSHLGRGAPTYEVLQRWPLGGNLSGTAR